MKKMFYYIKLNPDSSLSQGFRNKFKIQESWIQNLEVQDLSKFKPITRPRWKIIKTWSSRDISDYNVWRVWDRSVEHGDYTKGN